MNKLTNTPFPECSGSCDLVETYGVGECESFCNWKFDENGNSVSEKVIKERLETIGMIRSKYPFEAKSLLLGDYVWFIAGKDGKNICQMIPSTNEKGANEIANLLNIAVKAVYNSK